MKLLFRRLGFVALQVGFALIVCASASSQTSSPGNYIDQVLEKAVSGGKMSGAVVLIGQRDKVLYRKAVGDRSVQPSKEPMTIDTVFDLASLTKPVATATSIIALVEQGRLSLDDRIGKFFPEIEDEDAKRVTIRQLLTHTSGYRPDFDLGKQWAGRESMLEELKRERLRHPPGTRFVYSDIGFIILGEIVQRVSGQRLDQFSGRILREMGMSSTGFLPLGQGIPIERVAPSESVAGQQAYLGSAFRGTDQEGSRILRGEVHDPTANRMGGIAGHAGLFSTADDLAKYCQMILSGGELNGTRVLSESAVSTMTSPVVVSSDGSSRGLGWDIDTRFSGIRGALFPKGSFGHTGFTGTGLWMDPVSGTYVIFLSSRLHPDGKGDITDVRAAVSTIAATFAEPPRGLRDQFESAYASRVAAGTLQFDSVRRAASANDVSRAKPHNSMVLTGIDVLEQDGFKPLEGLKVGLVTNQTGRNLKGTATIDLLFQAENVALKVLFSPEHGIRGDLDQERIADSKDTATGLPIFSLYGATRRPSPESLSQIDALVFDIQDIGTRFYTYISTLRYVLEEAAKADKPVFVLDRPNPLNGIDLAGSFADESSLSFTAAHTIPVRHGMTVGELALMMNAERLIGADVRVIKMTGWTRRMWFDETGREWVNPSPNMRSLTQALLYPGIGLLETTNLSVGRGTDTPFEVVGAPWMDGRRVASYLNSRDLEGVRFVPVSFTPRSSVFAGQLCSGFNVLITRRDLFEPVRTGTAVALALHVLHPNEWDKSRYSVLLANDSFLKLFETGAELGEFDSKWAETREKFLSRRIDFLLYK
ncbi:MAG: DUF1343 domain-containing protein [Acidobacteria bacterium]|nr:MAG: DUF1343 domain-containing protein [Acidobacteriota bacterium]REK01157.1 MAG: DUF1343 domain-containing protein [Acidobacteriota bacterium]REK14113.1 MAG: DUF1343 domain-containing protein [Acidobacteriota bacterium]REK44828.1 MAG: DUF1343 domain-containing protein [Acidobacteriota bacterium]